MAQSQFKNVVFIISDLGIKDPAVFDPNLETVEYKLVGRTTVDTLYNKTLINPIMNAIKTETGDTLSLPSTSGTLALTTQLGSGGNAIFGNGASGDLTLTNTSLDLGSDTYYDNLTLNNSSIKTRNNRLFVKGTLTLSNGSKIQWDGENATGAARGNGVGNTTSFPLAPSMSGGNGGVTNGTAGQAPPSFTRLGGIGGTGGTGTGGVAGIGGNGIIIANARGGTSVFNSVPLCLTGLATDGQKVYGGGGGGGGSGNGVLSGGGGGAGGGVVILSAKNIVSVGSGNRISSNGGSGAAGLGANCGGGGGGGGGVVVITTSDLSPSITIEANGGAGGGGPIPGNSGANGSTFININ
jgi:hypothetical protein